MRNILIDYLFHNRQLKTAVLSLLLITLYFNSTHCYSGNSSGWHFVDVTLEAGFNYKHGYQNGPIKEPQMIAGGVAAGDFNGDGTIDLYVVRGNIGPNLLFHNNGDGTFVEMGRIAGVDVSGSQGSGPLFVDLDNDSDLDLFVGGVQNSTNKVFRNDGNGRFTDVTAISGLPLSVSTYSASAADFDLDGDLDLFLSHWAQKNNQLLWENQGDGTFVDITPSALRTTVSFSFTGNFADINNDARPDLLITADFGNSQVFINNKDGTFEQTTTAVISDENGMGSAVGDVDNDGDLDWFVSSIRDKDEFAEGNWGTSGNRLYMNNGDGIFTDSTTASGVRDGYWGWGACFADFNNDGHLDLFHVNGFYSNRVGEPEFVNDPSRLFINNGRGYYTERSAELGIIDTGQGRGVVCFDADGDGDIDIFVANNSDSPRFYRNEGGNTNNYLRLRLTSANGDGSVVGTRVYAKTGKVTQMREVRVGSNFASQNPMEVHFGFGVHSKVNKLEIHWPFGQVCTYRQVPTNRMLVIKTPKPILGKNKHYTKKCVNIRKQWRRPIHAAPIINP